MDYAAIAAAAAGVISSLIASGQDAKAAQVRQQVLDQYGPEILPHLDKATAQEVSGSTLAKLPQDDSLRGTQLDTLKQLENEYLTGGMTEADKAANQLAMGAAVARNQSVQHGIENAMAQRGLQGGPMALALQQQAAQDATNEGANLSRQNSADARMRALQALEAKGGLATNVRGQDYQRLSDIASAQDSINMFNANQRASAQGKNIDLQQQAFDNDMRRRAALAQASGAVAAGYDNAAQGTRDTGNGIGQGLITWGTQKKKAGDP